MNRDEAKAILLLYRPGTTDAEDPQIAEALAVARRDEELARWLERHSTKQVVLSEKFRRIAVPAGLKEQIISEQAASEKSVSFWGRELRLAPMAATAAAALVLVTILFLVFPHTGQRSPDDTLAAFQNQMAGIALRGYGMDLTTHDPVQIRAYLAQNHAPADFILPEKLKQVSLAGCAIEGWQNVKVAMVCFRSRRAAPEVASDLWLFVVDRSSLKNLSGATSPQLSKINRLMTATWIQGDKLYYLGIVGDEQAIKQYL